MKLNNILRYSIIGGVFLLPLLPLVITKTMFFPFITGKNFSFRIIVEVVFAAWIILAWYEPAYRPKFSWILGALAVFLSIITLADIFGADPSRSFWSNYERMEGLVMHLHLFGYFLVASSVLNTRKLWWLFLHTSIGVSIVVGIYSILQLAGKLAINQGGVRVDATFGNATYLATYLVFHIFFVLFLLLRKKMHWAIASLYSGLILLYLYILINTATRGAILGLLGGVFLTAILVAIFERHRRVLRRVSIAAVISLVVLIGLFISFRESAFVKESPILARFSNISFAEGESRFLVWGIAWQGVKEHPILGWGQENFILPFNKYYDPRMYAQEAWFDRAHNIVFDWLIAAGVLGLLSYLSIFTAVVYVLWWSRGTEASRVSADARARVGETALTATHTAPFSLLEKSLIVGLLGGYFFQNVFVFDNLTSYLLFFSLIAFVHAIATEKKEAHIFSMVWKRHTSNNNETLQRIFAPLVIVALFLSVYVVDMKGILANKALLQALAARTGGPESNLSFFKKALSYNSFGSVEVREQLAQFSTVTVAGADIPKEIKQEYLSLAEGEMRSQIEHVPNNARYRLFLATLLDTFGKYEEALVELKEAQAISPRKQNVYYSLATVYLHLGEYDLALESAKTGYELAPGNEIARRIYATAGIFAGDDALAQEIFTPVYDSTTRLFISAYLDVGRFDRIKEIWKALIDAEPTNQQHHLSLAATYVELGEPQKAIAEIEVVVELNPEFREQADAFIADIRAGRKP